MVAASEGDVVVPVTCKCGGIYVRQSALAMYPTMCNYCGQALERGQSRTLGPGGAL